MKSAFLFNIFPLAILIGITFLLISVTNSHILTLEFFRKNNELLSGIPGEELGIYENLQKWIYLSSALYLIVKIIVISAVLSTALFMNNSSASFRKVFLVVTLSEYLFLLPALLKMIWFLYFTPHADLETWYELYILSALTLFPGSSADFHYLLQSLNLFEVAYWFLLAYGISKISRLSFDAALRSVMLSYVPAFAIWVIGVTFISILLFPS